MLFAHSVSPESAVPTLRVKKEELMYKIYTIMSASLGVPPKPDAAFIWEHYTEDGKYAKWEDTLQFYKAFIAIFVCSFIYAHGNSTPITNKLVARTMCML